MKKQKIKLLALIFIIIMTIITNSEITNDCQAAMDVTDDMEFWKPNDTETSEEFNQKLGAILGVVSTLGVITSVGTLSIIGIKFLLGSVEEKAQYKQALIPWLIGASLVFSITTVPNIIYNVMEGANKISTGIQISIDKSDVTLKIGENEEVKLNATITSEKQRKVTWITTNSKVATVDQNGNVKAKSEGEAIIIAATGKVEATCKITVKMPRTTAITISKGSITLNAPIEKTYLLKATVIPATSREPIQWSSSNKNVATVSNGKVTAVGKGTATITAKSGSKSATCTVQVDSSRVYKTQYYNQSTKQVFSSKTLSDDLGFWIYIPEVSQVQNIDKLPLIIYLHGSGECRE